MLEIIGNQEKKYLKKQRIKNFQITAKSVSYGNAFTRDEIKIST